MRMNRNSLADLVCSEWAFVMSIGLICGGSGPSRFPLFLFVLASIFLVLLSSCSGYFYYVPIQYTWISLKPLYLRLL